MGVSVTNDKINFLVEAYEQIGVSKDQPITVRLDADQYKQLNREVNNDPRTTKMVNGKEVDILPSALNFAIDGYSLIVKAK